MGVWPNRTRPVNRICLARGSGWNRQPWMSRYHISSSQPREKPTPPTVSMIVGRWSMRALQRTFEAPDPGLNAGR